MKGGKLPSPLPEKTTLKKPSVIRVNEAKQNVKIDGIYNIKIAKMNKRKVHNGR